jgi:isopenicillin N synthase-like dioxygenase
VNVPVVEHEDLHSTEPAAIRRAADAVAAGFGGPGLVWIRGAPVARPDVNALYDDFLEVLRRPTAEKSSWGGRHLWFQRGWTPPNTEVSVQGGGQPDFKECFFAAPEPIDSLGARQWPELLCDNVWPTGADRFRTRTLAVGHALHTVGMGLLGAAERALGLAEGAIGEACQGAAHLTRLLAYLPLDEDQVRHRDRVLWGEEHTDFNLLTLLPGGRFYRDGVPDVSPRDGGGLFLRTQPDAEHPTGQKVPGRPPPGCIVAQVGQELEILSGGTFLATPHGIVAPDEPGFVRTSVAHFVHLHPKTVLTPHATLRDRAGSRYDPPVLAGTYATKTLVDIGLAPREALDRFGYRHYDRLRAIRAREDGT